MVDRGISSIKILNEAFSTYSPRKKVGRSLGSAESAMCTMALVDGMPLGCPQFAEYGGY
jgi:hypothetical protein